MERSRGWGRSGDYDYTQRKKTDGYVWFCWALLSLRYPIVGAFVGRYSLQNRKLLELSVTMTILAYAHVCYPTNKATCTFLMYSEWTALCTPGTCGTNFKLTNKNWCPMCPHLYTSTWWVCTCTTSTCICNNYIYSYIIELEIYRHRWDIRYKCLVFIRLITQHNPPTSPNHTQPPRQRRLAPPPQTPAPRPVVVLGAAAGRRPEKPRGRLRNAVHIFMLNHDGS